jgi:protein-S-isoprenylcysteine O-methyltransferase Ste14
MALKEEFEKQGIWLFRNRGQLPLLVIAAGTFFILRTELNPELISLKGTRFEIPYEMFCLFVSLVGLSIRIYTTAHAHQNTSGRNSSKQKADNLNTTGIYSLVRHPLYLANYLMWLGPTMLTMNLWFIFALTLIYWLYYERIMFAEEQYLTRKFGDRYTAWADQVPAFIPRFRHFQPPEVPFNWRRVLRSEPNGLLSIFVIFTAFDIAGELIRGERNFNWFLIITTILVCILFLVLKYLKKRTGVLKDTERFRNI